MTRIAVVAVVLLGTALMPAAASAQGGPPDDGGGGNFVKVHELKPWKKKFLYRVQHGFMTRTEQSRLAPKTRTALAKGTWLQIQCQRFYGDELWDIVADGWVPDSVMKTYTDGRLENAPVCDFPFPDHVWMLQPWKASSQYRVEQAQTPQRKPHLGTGLPTTLEAGDWVTIECQTRGQKYGGSRLWERIGIGGYIPDSTVKTFTDGRIPQAPKCTKPKLPDPKFMALGDSYSSGLGGDGHFQGTTLIYDYKYLDGKPPGRDRDCYRSPYAHSRLLGRRLKTKMVHTARTFLACQGDTTKDVLDKQVPYIMENTRFITLTVGGNDMYFKDVLEVCAAPLDDPPGPWPSCVDGIQKAFGKKWSKLAKLGHRLDRLFTEISKKAPFARVAVIGYPDLFKPADDLEHCGSFKDHEVANLNLAGKLLNRTIRQAAGRHQGFHFVNLGGVFANHGPCEELGSGMWINPIVVSGSRRRFSAHPNRHGQRVIANRVARRFPGLFR